MKISNLSRMLCLAAAAVLTVFTLTGCAPAEKPPSVTETPPVAETVLPEITPSPLPAAPTPDVTEPPEPESYGFERQRAIRIRSFRRPEPGAVIIGSPTELETYLNQFKSYLGEELRDVSEDLFQLQNHYGYDQFYEAERLLCIMLEAPSGGDRFRLADRGLFRDSVVVEQIADGATYDMAYWLMVAEVDTMFDGGDRLEVTVDKVYDQYCPMNNVWFHRQGTSGRASSSATVIQSMDELVAYLEENVYYTDRVTGELIRDPELEELISIYGAPIPEWFFESETLLAFLVGSPVYNPQYEVLSVSSEAVTVLRDHYFYGNACPSTHLVLVEVHGEFDPNDPPELKLVDGYP